MAEFTSKSQTKVDSWVLDPIGRLPSASRSKLHRSFVAISIPKAILRG
jgi:hypothetical protein